jgi:hypothetical protein
MPAIIMDWPIKPFMIDEGMLSRRKKEVCMIKTTPQK